jgi:hypothetical protein
MIGESPFFGVALGLGLGARHALEPDHLAAVSVLAADRPGARRGLLIGALWGAGHTFSLLACGLTVAIAAAEIPAPLADVFELGVAAMLIALGARAVLRGRPAQHVHVHAPSRLPALRPVLVGAVHGLAGSGALVALTTAALPTTASRVAFMALFGCGSIGAMCAISGLAGWPLARLARRRAIATFLYAAAGLFSVGLGVLWAWIPLRNLLR